ncbi:MAG: fasciclin domain-containing protein [Actinomycetota bacterium]
MKFYKSQQNFKAWATLVGITALLVVMILPVFAQQSNSESQSVFQPSSILDSPKRSGSNLVETLAKEIEFQTLASALAIAQLNDTLAVGEKGALTIFAPTNQAFQKNATTYAKLLQPQNRDKLIRLLRYHLVKGEVKPEDVNRGEIQTLEGNFLKIRVTPNGVFVNERAKAIQPSIETSNGVIVRIDQLLIPPNF